MTNYVKHAITGQTGAIITTGFSPAGLPTYEVRPLQAAYGVTTWWYRSDCTPVAAV